MDRKQVAAIALILAVVGVGLGLFFANQGNTETEPTPVPKATAKSGATATASPAGSAANTQPTIRLTSNGFSPATLTVTVDATVTITNDSNETVNFASDPHPTHTGNPFLNVGNIEPGGSKTVTIPKAGTFTYHNHLDPSLTGTIVAK